MTPISPDKSTYEYYVWAATKAVAPSFIKLTAEEQKDLAELCLKAAIKLVDTWQERCGITLPKTKHPTELEAPPVEAIKLGASAETLPEVKAALLKEKIRQEEELHNLLTEEALQKLEREHRLK
jgi:hypothetical protein